MHASGHFAREQKVRRMEKSIQILQAMSILLYTLELGKPRPAESKWKSILDSFLANLTNENVQSLQKFMFYFVFLMHLIITLQLL